MNERFGLILEGGGFRGCYTAGAMKWLYDNGIEMPYTVSISAAAAYSMYYIAKMFDRLHTFSTREIKDKHVIGLIPIFTEGNIVGFDWLLKHCIQPDYEQLVNGIKNSNTIYEIGIYNMTKQELQYKRIDEMDSQGYLLKASCTLPVSGKMVEVDGDKYLDGGIEVMISVDQAKKTGHDKQLIIVTKDKNYVRKPNGFLLDTLIRIIYRKYPKMLKTLDGRVKAYYEQMDEVYRMEKEGDAILIRPTRDCGVKRFSGSYEALEEMYQLGWQDMEDRKEEIFRFLEIER